MTINFTRFVWLVLASLPFGVFGQNLTLTVTDAENNAPLPYANIYFKNSGVGISTNHSSIIIPKDFQVEMNYKKYQNFYGIDYINFSETKLIGEDEQHLPVLNTVNKSFYVLNIQTDNVQPIPDSTIFKSTIYSAIRFYKKNYNPDYWNTLTLRKDAQLSPKIIADLEVKKPLSRQFYYYREE